MKKTSAFPHVPSLGISLMELMLVIVILFLALAPVVKMLAGPTTANGNAVQMIGQKSKEIILANTIIERTLATDYSTFNCGGVFNPKTGFPPAGQSLAIPAGRCTDNSYNQPLFYQWTVRNMDPSGQKMPDGNHYYTAVLNVWNVASGGQPLLTLPTGFYWNEGGYSNDIGKTGIMIVQDRSGSMMAGSKYYDYEDIANCAANHPASPYLKYRYPDASIAYSPANIINDGNIYNNANLDITPFLQSDDTVNTAWKDQYMKRNVLGLPNCDVLHPWNSGYWKNYFLFIQGEPDGGTADDDRYVKHVNALCQLSAPYMSTTWTNTLNSNLSRFEVARSSLLSFLVSMESNPDLYQNTKLGFMTFSYTADVRVPLESANNGYYRNMRQKLTWMNRGATGLGTPQGANAQDNGPILPGGNTDMYYGVYMAAKTLFADKSLESRIIIIVGDGEPTCGVSCGGVSPPMCHTDLGSYNALGSEIGGGSFPGATPGDKATIFSMGLMADDPDMPKYLGDALADRTPGGQYFFAQSVGEVKPIFDQIQYQVQRLILLNKSNRYNVNFSNN